MIKCLYYGGMRIRTEADITRLVESDAEMMAILRAAEQLNLPDWWIGAGFLRNKVWDAIAGNATTGARDIDLVYFDPADVRPETDWVYDASMREKFPHVEWEVRNQARMHYKNNFAPFRSTEDGIAHWVETATCVAVRLREGKLELLLCYGIDDLINLVARPIEVFRSPNMIQTFYDRIESKHWRERWPQLKVEAS